MLLVRWNLVEKCLYECVNIFIDNIGGIWEIQDGSNQINVSINNY